MRRLSSCAVALLAAMLCARASAFTVDCNQDYADCEKEHSKLMEDDDPPPPSLSSLKSKVPEVSPTRAFAPVTDTTPTAEPTERDENVTDILELTTTISPKQNVTTFAKGRLLNLSVDELQSFANALHNQTVKEAKRPTRKHMGDLSDVSLDAEEEFEFPPHKVNDEDSRILHKGLSDSFYPNLQAPFGDPRLEITGAERSSLEAEACTENGVQYKVGESTERGCEESCECGSHGAWRCTPRCQQPYVRRGRRLTDPLCHETPVDDCCSIIACASGHDSDLKLSASGLQKSEPCRYGNNSYMLGQKWEVGCDQLCSCGPKSIVTCKPRCVAVKPSEHCISVQDPHDACCQVQVCDVTHDAHELDVPPPVPSPAAPAVPPASTTLRPTIEDRIDSDFNELIATTKPSSKNVQLSQSLLKVRPPLEPRPLIEPDTESDILSSTDPAPKLRPSLESRPLIGSLSPTSPRLLGEVSPQSGNHTRVETNSSEHLAFVDPVTSLIVLKNNTVRLGLARANSSENPFHLQISRNRGNTFRDIVLTNGVNLQGLDQGFDYVLKIRETGKTFEFTIPIMDASGEDVQSNNDITPGNTTGCISEGVHYNVGDEFRIGCSELCECVGPEQRECAALECPSHVGLELLSPACVRWAPDPPDWTPRAPACCPSRMRCLSDGSCDYRGHKIPNWSEVPITLTGCEQRCFCESGTLDCQEVCSALPPLPPQTLRCQPAFRPAPVNISDDDCCKQWGCIPIASHGPGGTAGDQQAAFVPTAVPPIQFPGDYDERDEDYDRINHIVRAPSAQPPPPPRLPALPGLAPPPQPPRLPGLPGLPSGGGAFEPADTGKLTLMSLVADSPTSVKILFELPSVLVGLRGSVDLRYTDKDDEDFSHWYSQVFAPSDEVLTTARLEFRLTGLKPSTAYRLRGKLYLHGLTLEPVSSVYTVRTLDAPPVLIEEKRRPVETALRVVQLNATTAQLTWRHFTEDELQYIDGIQVRYRPLEQPIYSMTELLHHARTTAELLELRPGSRYEAALVLVPPPRSPVELYDTATLNFTTPEFYDMYNWSASLEAQAVGAQSVQVTWRGVPAPPERYVRVYRAAHACDGAPGQRERDSFKLADRDQPPQLLLTGFPPDTKCRVWLELYLTNGKVKISNVLDVTTKSESSNDLLDNEVQASVAGGRTAAAGARGDYYGALVVVGVVAALGALTSLLLLLVVVRRHRPHSVSITPVPTAPRAPSLPPYDNPAYKLELQQETMDL